MIVSFTSASHSVEEGGNVTVAVTLDDNPGRTVVIDIGAANEGGASDADYSEAPDSVIFNSRETSASLKVKPIGQQGG